MADDRGTQTSLRVPSDERLVILAARIEMGLRFCNRCAVDTVPIQRDMCAFCDKVGLTDPKGIG